VCVVIHKLYIFEQAYCTSIITIGACVIEGGMC